jgi:hypothetical protein
VTKRNSPIYVKQRGRLVPAGGFDAERFDGFPDGTEFDLIARTRRSGRQNATYWLALHRIVEATGRWPNAETLHDALRRDLGYIHVQRDLAGEPYLAVDSTAFDAMNTDEFSAYFEQAMARLAEITGIDVLAFLDERRAA